MRHFALAIILALTSALGFGVIAPGAHAARIQPPPTNPVISVSQNPVTTNSSTIVHGTGFSIEAPVLLTYQRPNRSYGSFNVRTGNDGSFAVTLGFLPRNGTGHEYVRAYDYRSHKYSNVVDILVNPGTPVPGAEKLTISMNPVTVGQSARLTGTGFTANSYVYISYQRPDGTGNTIYAYTDSNGAFVQDFWFSPQHGCGTETFQVYDASTSTMSAPLGVTVQGC